ncbi:hypothetical protein PHLGIDRAFT_119111 [Phlebiopsis gigantea 11061_1 CR5-6]|uniref:Protein kinase domain-containing protein n=1 Tax=Phlebiopsis gigantea (strain 11061_1 CR5-6) TaxID=745531 RepID=A0A0C3RWY4_PHLG1|nr:hypothetical protein PHLGIDRAFT_119111 [Phlebiopsis gigantea 11061_1 CR5-6]
MVVSQQHLKGCPGVVNESLSVAQLALERYQAPLWRALLLDDYGIVLLLKPFSIFCSQSRFERVMQVSLQPQILVDLLYSMHLDWNEHGHLVQDKTWLDDCHIQLRRIIVRLCEALVTLPSKLWIQGVHITGTEGRQPIEPHGRGSFASVYRGTWITGDRCPAAIKAFNRFEFFKEEEFPHGEKHYLQAAEIAQTLADLHAQHIMHGDLHPGNVLVDSTGSVKITDFGLANFSDASAGSVSLARSGNARYKAPEIHEAGRNDEDIIHTEASDVFALAMLVWKIVSGVDPFPGTRNSAAIAFAIIARKIPERSDAKNDISDPLWDILRECWGFAPETRPRSADVAARLRTLTMIPQ